MSSPASPGVILGLEPRIHAAPVDPRLKAEDDEEERAEKDGESGRR
jgi:hypothetical protein